MIEYLEIPHLNLSIQKAVGDIRIEDIYEFAEKYILDENHIEYKYTIVDSREANLLLSKEEILEYIEWIKKMEEVNEKIHYVYLACSAKSKAFSMIIGEKFKENSKNFVFYTLKKALEYIGISEHYEIITKFLKGDKYFYINE